MYPDPRLVVLTGLPRAGKSKIADYLRSSGYLLCSSDALREQLIGVDWRKTDSPQRDQMLMQMLYGMAHTALYGGEDVVLDSTASTEQHRSAWLTLPAASKTLVWVKTPADIIRQRAVASQYDLAQLPHWEAQWEDPSQRPDCRLVVCSGKDADSFAQSMHDLVSLIRTS